MTDSHPVLELRGVSKSFGAVQALYQVDFHYSGFEWLDFHDWENSIIAFIRRAEDAEDFFLVCCNFTPVVRAEYKVGVPCAGSWQELLNSDAPGFAGSGVSNRGGVEAAAHSWHGRPASLVLTIMLAAIIRFIRLPLMS